LSASSADSHGSNISATSSSLLDFDNGNYDLFITSGSYSRVLIEGKVKLDKRVTN